MKEMKRLKGYLIFWIIFNLLGFLAFTGIGIFLGIVNGIIYAGVYIWIFAATFLVCAAVLIAHLVRHNYIEREAIYEVTREEVEWLKYKMKTNKKFIYVCSPYSGDVEKNTQIALIHCKNLYRFGAIPIAPHLYFTRFLNDASSTEREDGIEMGLHLMKFCDEVWVFGGVITDGMQREIKFAKENKIPVKEV